MFLCPRSTPLRIVEWMEDVQADERDMSRLVILSPALDCGIVAIGPSPSGGSRGVAAFR
jgi:hypothetical protein